MVARAWTHWATSEDLLEMGLPAHDAGTGLAGAPLGEAQFGGHFVFDVFDAYRAGLLTNPNVVVAGAIGAGKSTVVKMQLRRALARGRRVVVLDPKGEYGPLASHHGCAPVVLGRDGWCDPFGDVDQEGSGLLRSLLASALGESLGVEEHFVIDEVWRAVTMARPRRVLRHALGTLAAHVADPTPSPARRVALGLHRLVEGDLRGLFDGEGEPLTLEGDFVVVDLSAQWASSALPLSILAVVAAARRVLGDGERLGYLVLDEAWSLLGDASALEWLRGSWKLARARGVAHVLVLHRFSDVASVANAGTAQLERARGLLRETETAWLFRQPPDEAREIADVLELTALETRYLRTLPRGGALVRYGPHRSIVRVTPDAGDRELIDTDDVMRLT
ncbi:MAG TPA: DUF87 domain-containing protein [Acidimicrobiales bacterium]